MMISKAFRCLNKMLERKYFLIPEITLLDKNPIQQIIFIKLWEVNSWTGSCTHLCVIFASFMHVAYSAVNKYILVHIRS